jgi:hypothetical protein
VPTIAIGFNLEQRRRKLGPRPLDGDADAITHLEHIVGHEAIARHRKAGRSQRDVGMCQRPLQRRAHRVLVVLDDEHNRQLPQASQRHALEERALIDRAITEEAQRHLIEVAILAAERDPRSQGRLRTNDAVASEEAMGSAEHVHRATEPTHATGVLGRKLGKHRFPRFERAARFGHKVTVLAVRRRPCNRSVATPAQPQRKSTLGRSPSAESHRSCPDRTPWQRPPRCDG